MTNLKFYSLAPLPELKRFVRRILVTESLDEIEKIIPIAPTGFCYLTYSRFPLSLHYQSRVISSDDKLYLAGQVKDELPFISVKGSFFHVGLELYPATLYYLYGIEGMDLLDNIKLLADYDLSLATVYREQISTTLSANVTAVILQEQLIKKLEKVKTLSHLEDSLSIIYKHRGNIDASKIFEEIAISERHLRRQFKKIIGLSPKQYCKVIQFNAVFEAIKNGNEKQVYDWALECGYYDHAHFINVFKSMLGRSPQKFLQSDHSFLKAYLGAVK